MKMHAKKIRCLNRKSIPNENDNVIDDLELSIEFVKEIRELNISHRQAHECPFNRGNWIADITLSNKELLCIKLPEEMTMDKVLKFFKPLIDLLEKKGAVCEKKEYGEGLYKLNKDHLQQLMANGFAEVTLPDGTKKIIDKNDLVFLKSEVEKFEEMKKSGGIH